MAPDRGAALTDAVDVVLNYWFTVDAPNADPSWPMIARNTLIALAAEPGAVRAWLVEAGLLAYEDIGPASVLVWKDDE